MIKTIIADGKQEYKFLQSLKKRAGESDINAEKIVCSILEDVKENGDSAVISYGKKFDKADSIVRLTREDMKEGFDRIDENFKRAIKGSKDNIETFHRFQKTTGFELKGEGYVLGQTVRGLNRVALYVPGGTAAYPSTVLMNAIPAKLAGVAELVMLTPPNKEGKTSDEILSAAYISGVDEILLIGGAQGVAAVCYGTESIQKVDKIVGPGNIYVATAKKLVFGTVDIDMIAGPSEILIIADESANPKYVAADLMSQAEHDILASAILLTTSIELAKETEKELNLQSDSLSRKSIIQKSLTDFGGIIVCKTMEQMIELANLIAPEHLEIMIDKPFELLDKINNAGSIFLGHSSPEPLGDYYAGTNHVLPTSGTARFFSPLSVDSFTKKTQYIWYSENKLQSVSDDIVTIAEREGLSAHANSIKVRKKL